MTNMDLTRDHGASNRVDKELKDIYMAKNGLNASNESPESGLTVDNGL